MSPDEVFFALDFGDPDPAVIDVMERLLEENDQPPVESDPDRTHPFTCCTILP